MEYFTLYNGISLPATGFGVFRLDEGEATAEAVRAAVDSGYRHIDTARGYWNEADVGDGIGRSSLPRQNVFITTKVWMHYMGEESTCNMVLDSVKKLGKDYIDLVLLHQAYGDYYGSWRALETLYMEGTVRAIGVSNFTAQQLADLCIHSRVRPAVNQIHIDPLTQRRDLEDIHRKYRVQLISWSPLGAGNDRILKDPVLTEIALSHGKSTAQIVLRWLYQRGIASVVKTSNPERMRENLSIFDFELSPDDMARIAELDEYGEDSRDLERAEMIDALRLVEERYSYKY